MVLNIEAEDRGGASCRLNESREDAKKRGLPGPVSAKETKDLSPTD